MKVKENKKLPESNKLKKPGKKRLAAAVAALLFLIVLGAGVNFYIKYKQEQAKQLAMEEQQRQEEEERERLRKLLEEKKAEFSRLIEEMKKYLREGNFGKVRELAEEALLLAKEYGFPTDEIESMLHEINVQSHLARLKELKALSEDIFLYLYVRTEAFKIPNWPELRNMRSAIISASYENEYKVSLIMARHQAGDAQKGVLPKYNYMSSKAFLDRGIALREKHDIEKSEEEPLVKALQRELFFASKKLFKDTIPLNLY